jgi:glycerate-2-kinase
MVARPTYASGKRLAEQIFLDALAAIGVRYAMLQKVKREGDALVADGVSIPLWRPPRVLAFGKAANRMAAALNEILSGQVQGGVIVSPAEPPKKLERFRYFVGGHPYPNAGSFEGAEAALELVSGLTPATVYHFRVRAVNGEGAATSLGRNQRTSPRGRELR